jgi:hypothetical protein
MGTDLWLSEASCKLASKDFCPQGATLKSEADFCAIQGPFCIVKTLMSNGLLPTCADDAHCTSGIGKKLCCSDVAKVMDIFCDSVDAGKVKAEMNQKIAPCQDKSNLKNQTWRDSYYDECEDYNGHLAWCKDADKFANVAGKYTGWQADNTGSASQLCCACGGGIRTQVW